MLRAMLVTLLGTTPVTMLVIILVTNLITALVSLLITLRVKMLGTTFEELPHVLFSIRNGKFSIKIWVENDTLEDGC